MGRPADDREHAAEIDVGVADRDALRLAYRRTLATSARESARVAGILLLIAFPLWSVFDFIVVPSHAITFLKVRIGFEVLIAGAVVASRSRLGKQWPEQLAVTLALLPEIAIAWMLPRTGAHLDAYLLGFTLTIFATAVVLVWRWQLTVVVVAGSLGATIASFALDRGAVDATTLTTMAFYLVTAGLVAVVGQLYRYNAGWTQFATSAALEHEQQRNQTLLIELEQLSGQDPLTGLANRRAWEAWLDHEMRRSNRTDRPFAVLLCDIDRFKQVNDMFGHATGDDVLRFAAAAFQSRLRGTDFIARLGGDEFIVGCPDTSADTALVIAEELCAIVRALQWPCGSDVTVSIGVTCRRDEMEDAAAVVARADAALYAAKVTRDTVVSDAGLTYPWPRAGGTARRSARLAR